MPEAGFPALYPSGTIRVAAVAADVEVAEDTAAVAAAEEEEAPTSAAAAEEEEEACASRGGGGGGGARCRHRRYGRRVQPMRLLRMRLPRVRRAISSCSWHGSFLCVGGCFPSERSADQPADETAYERRA